MEAGVYDHWTEVKIWTMGAKVRSISSLSLFSLQGAFILSVFLGVKQVYIALIACFSLTALGFIIALEVFQVSRFPKPFPPPTLHTPFRLIIPPPSLLVF